MAITLDGTLGITTPSETNTGTLSVTGVTTLTGTLSAANNVTIYDATLNTPRVLSLNSNRTSSGVLGTIRFGNAQFNNNEASIVSESDGAIDAARLMFSTTPTSGSITERMRITSTGNVTVGTDDLGYKLGALSTSTGTPALFLRSNAASDAGTAQLRISKSTTTNTTSQIFAQFLIDGNGTSSGQINANGASAAAFGSFSDVRLKENIVNLPSQLANITALRPVEFDYKDGCGHQIGFIAQEMEQVYPDAIGVGENEMLTITGWSKTEARLVKAIQEQQSLITQLQADVATLKALSA